MSAVYTIETTTPHPFKWPLTQENLALHGGQAINFFVLYFYPKDDTPGCTTETIAFNAHIQAFANLGSAVLGISRDSVGSHDKFKKKHNIHLTLIADTDSVLCKAFDVIKLKKNYGKEYMGIERSTFIIDQAGKVLQEWRKVRVAGHVEEVLSAVRLLTSGK